MLSTNIEFSKLLNDCRIDKDNSENKKFTHTGMSKNRGSYVVDDEQNELFYDLYYKHVFKNKNTCSLIEQHTHDRNITPIRIDLDFRTTIPKPSGFNSEMYNNPRLYQIDEITGVCKLYISIIKQWYMELTEEECTCYIMEKESSKSEEKSNKLEIKDGVHIMFPNIAVPKFIQIEIRNKAYKLADEKGIFESGLDNTYSDIFDLSIIKTNGWLMYGSQKQADPDQTYKVTNIYEFNPDITENFNDETYTSLDLSTKTDEQLVRLLSIRNKTKIDKLAPQHMVEYNRLQQMYNNNKCQKKQSLFIRDKNKIVSSRAKEELQLITGCVVRNESHEITGTKPGYVDCLRVERCISEPLWIQVGWALYNIDNCTGENKSKNIYCCTLRKWIHWSKQPGSGYENEPDYTYLNQWDSFKTDGYGVNIGSLKLWAKEDAEQTHKEDVEAGKASLGDKTLYDTIVAEDLHTAIMKCLVKGGGSSYDIANLMKQIYKDDYICVSIEHSRWYYFDKEKHRWFLDDQGIRLKSKISTYIWDIFNEKGKYFSSAVEDNEDVKNISKRDNSFATCKNLKTTNTKANIMSECKELFHDTDKIFLKKLDNNDKFLGFNNGVYDLENHEFRSGKPEDYMSLSTGIEYSCISKWQDSEELDEIQEFLSQVITDTNVRNYIINLMSTFICGSTKNEKFHVWSGSGGNGKSKLIELLEYALGDYSCKMSIQNLTSKRGEAGAANPEMARTQGKRFLNLQEPDEKCKLNVGLMKEMTGGDKIIARALYKEPVEFKPQFKMVLTCNQKPQLPNDDEGTWRRVVLIEFNSKFTPNPKGSWKNYDQEIITKSEHNINKANGIFTDIWDPENKEFPQFPMNEELNDKFKYWTEPFMSMLIDQFTKKIPLIEPVEVEEYTKEYRMTNDFAKQFLDEVVVNDVDGIIKISELYNRYKKWLTETDGSSIGNQFKRNDLIKYINSNYPENKVKNDVKNNQWKGIRIKIDNDFVDDDDDNDDTDNLN